MKKGDLPCQTNGRTCRVKKKGSFLCCPLPPFFGSSRRSKMKSGEMGPNRKEKEKARNVRGGNTFTKEDERGLR